MDWEEFFKSNGEDRVQCRFLGNKSSFSVEELYQAIRARLQQEIVADVPGTSHYGLLVARDETEGTSK